MSKKEDINPEDSAEKYFDEENYSTLIIGADKNEGSAEENAGIAGLLIEGLKENKVGALRLLKEQNAQLALLNAIDSVTDTKDRSLLVAACWESGLDFTNHFDEFMKLLGDSDPLVSLEALTVLENIENFSSVSVLESGIKKLDKLIQSNHINAPLLEDLRLRFESIIEEMNSALN
ncbi:MAG TPA: hypothetical protein VGF30_13185 [Bacteroidia bacterium]